MNTEKLIAAIEAQKTCEDNNVSFWWDGAIDKCIALIRQHANDGACPWCGSELHLEPWQGDGFGRGDKEVWFIGCKAQKHFHCPTVRAHHGTKEQAIAVNGGTHDQ